MKLSVKSLSEQKTSLLIKTLRCPSCGAPMKPSAESILTICNFCGEIVTESKISPHIIVKPLPMTPPPGVGTIKKMELILVPFFEVKGDIDVDASGYQRRERTETRTVTRGGKTYTESKTIVEYRPWRIQHHGSNVIRFLARQEVTMFGASEFISSVTRNIGGEPVPFNPDFIKKLASSSSGEPLVALSPEWNQNEANKKAGEVVYEAAYQRAKSEMHEVFDTKVKFQPISNPALIHEPLLLIRKVIQGRSYRAAYHWGNGQLLREEQPIKNRGLMMIIALLGFLVTPVFVQLAVQFYDPADEDTTIYLIIFLVLAAAFVIAGIVLMIRANRTQKVKSSGGRVGLGDFQIIPPAERSEIYQEQQELQYQQLQQQQQRPSKSGFCPKCGDPLDESQQFCEKCGYKNPRSR